MNLTMRLIKEDSGQGLYEYILIIAIISLVAIAASQNLRNALLKAFESMVKAFPKN